MKAEKDKKTGKWLIQYRYTDWQGKRRKSTKRGFATKREAEEWLRNFLITQNADFDMKFTPTDIMLNCIDNVVLRIIVAVLILMVIYFAIVIGVTIYTKQRKQVKIFDLHSNHSLFVEYGDLFNSGDPNEEKNIAFAGNRCFDTIVDDDLIGSKKIHGMALKRIYEQGNRDSDTVSNEIQNNLSLHGYKYIDLKPKEKRSGNLRRYDVGSVAEINGLNNEQYVNAK